MQHNGSGSEVEWTGTHKFHIFITTENTALGRPVKPMEYFLEHLCMRNAIWSCSNNVHSTISVERFIFIYHATSEKPVSREPYILRRKNQSYICLAKTTDDEYVNEIATVESWIKNMMVKSCKAKEYLKCVNNLPAFCRRCRNQLH